MYFFFSTRNARGSRAGVPRQKTRVANRPFWRVSGWLLAFLILTGAIVFGPGDVKVAHASSSQLLDYNEIGTFPAPTFVQHHPKVYLVFWGPQWENNTGTISLIEQTFQALAGSAWNNVLGQYTDSATSSDSSVPLWSDYENNNYVHNDVELMTGPGGPFQRVIDTTSPPGGIDIGIESSVGVLWGAQIRNESDKEIALNGWSINPDSQIIVFPQEGTTYNTLSQPHNWCGMHTFNTTAPKHYAYALIQYGDQNASCGTSGADIAYTAVHEYAEAATDPLTYAILPTIGSGWHTANTGQESPQEVADLCESKGSYEYVPVNGGGPFYLPYLWSNADNTCVSAIGQEFVSPDTAYPYHGIHTVHGTILSEYVNVGQAASVIGPPISEEIPIGGGRVSYFTGECGTNYPTGNCAAIYWSPATGAHYVRNAEYKKYVAVGEAASVIGFPVTDDTAIGSGSVTYFNGTCGCSVRNAGIYWSGGSGAHYVRGAEFQEYVAVGEATSVIGFPVTDDTAIGSGSVTYFNGTCGGANKCAGIYWSGGTGAHYVRNAEFQDYVGLNEAAGPLGFPLTDDTAINGGSATYFTANYGCGQPGPSGSDGAIYWSANTGAHAVYGCIYAYYQQRGGLSSIFGFPMSDETGITDYWGNPGRVNYFQGSYCGTTNHPGSAVYWWSGAHEVHGCIFDTYYRMNGPNSKLGFPISDEYTNSLGYRESDFSNGEIVWENGNAVVLYDTSCVTTGKCN